MSLRMGLGPVAACAAFLALAPLSFCAAKIATISLQKAVFDTADIKKASAEMEARYKPRADALRQTQEQMAQSLAAAGAGYRPTDAARPNPNCGRRGPGCRRKRSAYRRTCRPTCRPTARRSCPKPLCA